MSEGDKPKLEIYLIVAYKSLHRSGEVSISTLRRLSTELRANIRIIDGYKEKESNRVFCFLQYSRTELLAIGERVPYLIDKKSEQSNGLKCEGTKLAGTKIVARWKDHLIGSNHLYKITQNGFEQELKQFLMLPKNEYQR